MVNWSCSTIRPWHAFLGLAAFVCVLCLASNSNVQDILRPSRRYALNYWPTPGSQKLQTWELNSVKNYTLTERLETDSVERFYEFDINEMDTYIDGKLRKVIAINHKFPGPLIEANEGDTIRVRVSNHLATTTSLHFHGLTMNGTNFFDGASGITQCGIAPNQEFEYDILAEPAGTYWYHSHSGLQFAQGFVGPMVIHRREETEGDAFEQHVVVLNDLYAKDPDDLMAVYREPWLGGDSEPVPDIALAQGKMYPNLLTGNHSEALFRFVNAASNTAFNLQLGNPAKNFTVVEADGTLVKHTEVDHLVIFPSQRYSVLVPLEDSQWLFANPQFAFYDSNIEQIKDLRKKSSGLRILVRRRSLPERTPSLDVNEAYSQLARVDIREPSLEPLFAEPVPAAESETFVDLSMTRTSEGSIAGAINNEITIIHEQGSILGDFLKQSRYGYASARSRSSHTKHRHHEHSPPTSPVIFAYNGAVSPLVITSDSAVMDFVIRNFDDGFHPLHLHGHKFWVIERGMLTENGSVSYRSGQSRGANTLQPALRRDTVAVAEDEWVRIRVTLDNPGIWLLHCHIPWHSLSGMRALVVAQPTALTIQARSIPQQWWQLCDTVEDL